jgi:hypothetical protein
MNRRYNNGSSDGLEEANSKDLAIELSALDEPTVRQLKRQMIHANGHVQWRAMASSTG